MDESRYMPRLIDSEIQRKLRAFGAILIEGPKYCGKTTSAERVAASTLYMQDEDRTEEYLQMASLKPSNLLVGDKPRLIDEWQMAPKLWGAVRYDVDRRAESGLYILTGSASVDESVLSHSGAGRIGRLTMRTMSLLESGDSTGDVPLSGLLSGADDVDGVSGLGYSDLARILARGGWPRSIHAEPDVASDITEGYCEAVLRSDIHMPDGRRKDPERMRRVLRSLSRNESTAASNNALLRDMTSSGQDGMSPETLSDYIRTLKAVHMVEDLPAWGPRLRSKTTVRTGDTRHLCDPAVAAYFLGAGPWDLETDPRTFGLLFESMAVRDVRVYAQSLGGRVYHYRDEDGLEADMVVHLNDGRWGAMEVKLGQDQIDRAARNLLRLRDKVDTDSMNAPSFLAVVTGTEFAYTREDGVHVIPLGCLGR